MNEQQAKAEYEAAKKEHEEAVAKTRAAQMELTLASEDYDRARKRYGVAEDAREKAMSAMRTSDLKAQAAFTALGRIQLETKGRVG